LSKKAQKVCVAYDDLERFFPKEKIIKTGNPVRQDLLNIDSKRREAIQHFGLVEEKKTLLVLGGSLGAKAINELLKRELDFLQTQQVQIIWQTGKLYYNDYKINGDIKHVHVHEFINRMDYAYAASDFIISRAGASSVSELCIVGKPVVFVPSPYVAEDHQTKNANAIVKENAAILIAQADLEVDFKNKFSQLVASQEKQDQLSNNIKKLALVNATKHIADEVEKLLKQ